MRPHPAVLAAALALAPLAAPGAAAGLQPYQLVRSLQLVQDRIANGDHAALPMQRKILEMIDARLGDSSSEDFSDNRNFRALMVYAMSGGNPVTVGRVVKGLVLDDADARLAAGLIQYTRGNLAGASAALKGAEPTGVPADIGHILALVKGTVLAGTDPANALRYLDYARLLGPGTLIEEAALRRSMLLSIETADSERFLRASEQYVRRFLRSPYASQFADSFVAGVAALHATVDVRRISAVIDAMTPEQQKITYLRIARQAAIERLSGLLAFATAALESYAPDSEDDPRAALYSALASVASEDVMAVRERLDLIDTSRLSSSDRMLLEAAKALVSNVVSLPLTSSVGPGAEAAPSIATDAAAAAAPGMAPAAGPATASEPGEAAGASSDFINETRRRLEAVDRLLEETRP